MGGDEKADAGRVRVSRSAGGRAQGRVGQLQAGCAAEVGGARGLLPGKARLAAPEMTVGRGPGVDRAPQVEVADNDARASGRSAPL